MNRLLKTLVFVSALSVGLFVSCNDEETLFTVGGDWIDTDTRVLYIDTMTVRASTFRFDSLEISESALSKTNRALVGAYLDPVFGKVRARCYTQFQPEHYSVDRSGVYDSIALIMGYNTYFYNDTLQQQTFSLYEVLEDIRPEDGYYYNTTRFKTGDIPISSGAFSPRPVRDDSLHIRMDDRFGYDLFKKIQNGEITNADEFLRQYKGLAIEADESNTAILGFFKNSCKLRVYYTLSGETGQQEHILDLPFHQTHTLNNIYGEYEGTPFEMLQDQQIHLLSGDADNHTYAQAGTGIATRIDIPYLESLYDISGSGVIIDARLKLSLNTAVSGTGMLPVRDSLSILVINQRSEPIGRVFDPTGEYEHYATKIEDNAEFGILSYELPIKTYLDSKAKDHNGHNWFLAVYPQEYGLVDRYVFHGEGARNDVQLKLELTYAIYDEE